MTLIHESVPFSVHNTIKDRIGRYLIIQGPMLLENLNLFNVNGPNSNDPGFYVELLLLLTKLQGQYIIAGDFNCTLDPSLHRSTGIDHSHCNSRLSIKRFMTHLKVLHIWRVLNKKKQGLLLLLCNFPDIF